MAKRRTLPDKQFTGQAKSGEVRNPYGRGGKPMPEHRKIKDGLLTGFMSSEAMMHLLDMLNMKLPAFMKPENADQLTLEQKQYYINQILKNFKWAVEVVVKVIPKELGVFGKIDVEHSLTGLTKRAVEAKKSSKVIEMEEQMEKDKILKYVAKSQQDEEEDE